MYYNEVKQWVAVNNTDAIYKIFPMTFSFTQDADGTIQFPAHNLGVLIDYLVNKVPQKNRHMLYNIAQLLIYQLKYIGKSAEVTFLESIIGNQKFIHHMQDEHDPKNILSSPEWSENSLIAQPIKYDSAQPEQCLYDLLAILTDTLFEKGDKIESLINRIDQTFYSRPAAKKSNCFSQLCGCFGLFQNSAESQPILQTSTSRHTSEDEPTQNCCSACCPY